MTGEDIIWAAASGNIRAISAFIENGADIGFKNPNGATALHFAANRHHAEIVTLLLDHGAAIDARDHLGETPLFWTTCSDSQDTAAILLARGANPLIRNKGGLTPQQAARNCHFDNLADMIDEAERRIARKVRLEKNLDALDKITRRRPPPPT